MDPANSAMNDDEDAAMQAGFDSDSEDAPVSGDKPQAQAAAGEGRGDPGPQAVDAGTADGQTPQTTDQATTPEPKADDATADDPFAALPPAVRSLLAKVPAMQSELADAHKRTREIEGLARSLQSRLDKAEAASKTSGATRNPTDDTSQAQASRPGRKLEKLERVRATLGEDLPEVIEALDEIAGLLPGEGQRHTESDEARPTAVDGTPGSAQGRGVDPVVGAHLATLDELRPGWFEKLESDDARLWLAANRDMATRYAQADTPAKLIKVLDAFDAYRSNSGQAQRQAVTSQARRSAGVVPDGQPRTPTRGRAMSEEEAMERAFNS